MATTDVWMPLYSGDYLRDTMNFSTEEHGCYLLLLMHYWTEKRLSDDLDELMMVTRLQPERRRVLEKILKKYFEHQEGRYVQKRMEAEISRAQNIRDRNRRNAAARWGDAKSVPDGCQTDTKTVPNECQNGTKSDAKRVPKRCPPQPQSHTTRDTSVSLVGGTAADKENRSVYHLIEQAFLQENQDWNYGKEGRHILELEKKCLARPDPESFAKSVVALFWQLTHRGNDKLFRKQPFLPSILNSSGLWPRVVKELEEAREKELSPEDFEHWRHLGRRAAQSER